MEEIEDKLNIHYLENILDFIKVGPKVLDIDDVVDDIVECFNQPELLKKLKMRMLNINRRLRYYIRKSIRYKYSRIKHLGSKFKKNQTKGQRKGYWYKTLQLIQKMIEKGEREKAIEFAKGQVEWLKERRPATYYRHKKDLKELEIEIL